MANADPSSTQDQRRDGRLDTRAGRRGDGADLAAVCEQGVYGGGVGGGAGEGGVRLEEGGCQAAEGCEAGEGEGWSGKEGR